MKIQQFRWSQTQGWEPDLPGASAFSPQLILVFGGTALFKTAPHLFAQLRTAYPAASCLGCSTAGEIYDTQVTDGSLVATAIEFEHTRVSGHCLHLQAGESSVQAGVRLAQRFDSEGLVHLFVLSDGLQVNGSELIRGLTQALPPTVTITGGLAGDGDRFQETFVQWNESLAQGFIAAVGFYGDRLKIGYGSLGGWTPFGTKRLITKSRDNVLYELDGESALALYKKYLDDYASGLPATGLLFPLNLYGAADDRAVVRTILSIDEAAQSLTFAGDVPEGSLVQLMRANMDRLVEGAIAAAQTSLMTAPDPDTADPGSPDQATPDLAVLISCVGRKLVLHQRIEEEVDGVREVMGQSTRLAGFYSYGEIAPAAPGQACELHNQTMTITTFLEQ